jgi:hypothetical protein
LRDRVRLGWIVSHSEPPFLTIEAINKKTRPAARNSEPKAIAPAAGAKVATYRPINIKKALNNRLK